jgi:hypothetical protein
MNLDQGGFISEVQHIQINKYNTAPKWSKTHNHLNRCRNSFNSIKHSFLIKALTKLRTEGTEINIIKPTYEESIGNIVLSRESLRAFLPKSGTKQGCPHLFNIVLEFLVSAIRQEKKKKRHIGKRRSQIIPICR